MKITPLQKARLAYVPKLPGMLRHGIAEICVKEGEARLIKRKETYEDILATYVI